MQEKINAIVVYLNVNQNFLDRLKYQKAKDNMYLFFIKLRPLVLVIKINMFPLKKAFSLSLFLF